MPVKKKAVVKKPIPKKGGYRDDYVVAYRNYIIYLRQYDDGNRRYIVFKNNGDVVNLGVPKDNRLLELPYLTHAKNYIDMLEDLAPVEEVPLPPIQTENVLLFQTPLGIREVKNQVDLDSCMRYVNEQIERYSDIADRVQYKIAGVDYPGDLATPKFSKRTYILAGMFIGMSLMSIARYMIENLYR